MTDTPTPDSLRPGSLVGPWRVEGYAGRGTYGVVYRARRAGHPSSVPVALKLAVFPYDPRFMREVELLSRVRHPSVPQLLDWGWWHAGPEAVHPYLVMEWIRGLPLYEWAREHHPTQRQLFQVVAQVAWGLEVLHRADGLHRDVKGDNILVEPEGRAVLTDFGSGTWKGAPPITERVVPPNTREYRSPEALRFEWGNWRKREARYEARPADDLYALGVTVYRLLTGVYPPPGTDPELVKEQQQVSRPRRLPVQELNERVVPELAALVEQLLAEEPEARGRAREVAEAAESAAEHLGPQVDVPFLSSAQSAAKAVAVPVPVPSQAGSEQPRVKVSVAVSSTAAAEPRGAFWAVRPVLVAATVALMVGGTCWMAPDSSPAPPEVAQREIPDAGAAPDAGTRGLGEGALTARVVEQEVPSASVAIALEMPTQPLPGQRRPPCRRDWEVVIHGGCWKYLGGSKPPCGDDDEYEWQGSCYAPARDRTRPPTSKNPQQ